MLHRISRRIGPVGAVGLLGLIIGLLLLFLASGDAAAIGLIIAVLSVAFALGPQLPQGLTGGFVVGAGRRSPSPAPVPDYIDQTEEPSEELWQREQARYREKNPPS